MNDQQVRNLVIYLHIFILLLCLKRFWRASIAKWLRPFKFQNTYCHLLPLTAVPSNLDRDFGYFHLLKLSS
jgi:hypothetical protein